MNQTNITTRGAWMIRPFPHNNPRINEFREKGLVAIGWPGIGDLTGKSREELKQLLSGKPYELDGLKLGQAYGTIDLFVNQIRPGDLVLVPNGDDIYFAEITGGYRHDPSVDNNVDGYPHQRAVSWFPATAARRDLSSALRISLRAPRTAADLSHHVQEIEALARGEAFQPAPADASGTTQVSYPLRPGCEITFSIPNDITRQEAQRLSAYFASLYFVE